ncbi:MAG: FKBP-type peptidyl-prolyl cis-trans isomerase N-terminal domain-containing protein [Bacteroidota bacterium]
MKITFGVMLLMICVVATAQQDSTKVKKSVPSKKQQMANREYLKTVQDKMSYVIGYDVGQKMIMDMTSKNLDFNTKVFLKAVQDAFEGKRPVLSDEEARNVLMLFEQLMKASPEERKKLQQQLFNGQ